MRKHCNTYKIDVESFSIMQDLYSTLQVFSFNSIYMFDIFYIKIAYLNAYLFIYRRSKSLKPSDLSSSFTGLNFCHCIFIGPHKFVVKHCTIILDELCLQSWLGIRLTWLFCLPLCVFVSTCVHVHASAYILPTLACTFMCSGFMVCLKAYLKAVFTYL